MKAKSELPLGQGESRELAVRPLLFGLSSNTTLDSAFTTDIAASDSILVSDNMSFLRNGEVCLEIDIEGRIWRKACDVFGARLQFILEEALLSFKRQPGLDEPTRLHASQISPFALQVLGDAMVGCNACAHPSGGAGYLDVRSRLRLHLSRHLQWQLMHVRESDDQLSEDYLATDLGL